MIVDNLSLMVAYLFLLLCIPAYVFLCSERDSVLIYKVSAVVQIFLTSLFYLIWGGYSADAPIYNEASIWYSFEFPNVNWYYLFKVLFYYPLSLLNKIIHPPWPLRIISFFSVLIYIIAIVKLLNNNHKQICIALGITLLMPAFYLLFGNAIRQGVAASFVMLGFAYYNEKKGYYYFILFILGALIHAASILFISCILLSKLKYKWIVAIIIISPTVSYVFNYIISFQGGFGLDLPIYIYGDSHEGLYHYERFIVSYILSIIILIYYNKYKTNGVSSFILSYPIMVGLSSMLLWYQIPFARFLAFSDFLIPVVIAKISDYSPFLKYYPVKLIISLFILYSGFILWTHPSIIGTLGYAF